jgi:UDP-galactopyranose mutase
MPALATALGARLATRKVVVHTGVRATDLVLRGGRAVAVATDAGELDAEVVVCAVDPHRLPALAAYVARTESVEPNSLTHVALAGRVPETDPDSRVGRVVWHGRPDITIHPGLAAEGDHTALTLEHRGRGTDPLRALAERGLDLRDRVVTRLDDSPGDQSARWSGSPWGVVWRGRATVGRRLGPSTPIPGVYAAGAHATPGAGVPFVGLSAALVAQAVGPPEDRPES